MASTQTYSIPPEALERFHKVVPAGQRSVVVTKLIVEYCDKLDGEATGRKLYTRWIETVVSPFIQKYSTDNKVDPFVLWSDKGTIAALKAAGIEATQEDVRKSIEYILRED